MFKVGVTGGIGSGKSVVCQVFATLGVPVFDADAAARYLMENDRILIHNIKKLLGDEVYIDGRLQREKVAAIIFEQPVKLKELNQLVHPKTISYSNQWMEQQNALYILKEAAILFESGSNKRLDMVIGVFAPEALRVKRVMERSGYNSEKVLSIMARQMDETKKMKLCDAVIINDDIMAVLPQALKMHTNILNTIASYGK